MDREHAATGPAPAIPLWKKIQGKALWYSFVAQSLWWTRQKAGFFPVKHGQLFIEPREGWRAFLRAHDAWEPAIIEKLDAVIRPGEMIMDLGSNYGEFALQMADLAGKEGRVVGVEMDPHYVTILHMLREFNPILRERFQVVHAPLSEKNDLHWIHAQSKIIPSFYFADIEGAEKILVEQVFADPKWTQHNPRFLLELHPEIYGEEVKREIIDRFTREGYSHEGVDYKHYYFWRSTRAGESK
jgi:SAM-dependent methyltransferase